MTSAQTLPEAPLTLTIFPSNLGWMAVVAAGAVVKRLSFGHSSPAAAKRAVGRGLPRPATPGKRDTSLVRRLQAYASGAQQDFRDVPVAAGPLSEFRQRILAACRKIPYGRTLSYNELAVRAGFPRAARAVGNCMAANAVPLIVPCHRVVRSDGRPGSYSAPGGTRMKRRLLALESGKLA